MKFRGWIRAIVAVVALVMPAMIFAATQNAVLYGEVYDSAGNPAPNISVSLDNAAIGFARTTVTGADGSYNFPEVPPAENYTLSAARNGSKIDARAGIVVNVGDEKVVLPPLKEQAAAVAASATPNPEVTAKVIKAPAVSNDVSTAISGVITGEQLRSLPVAVNRNFLNAGLIPPSTHDVQQGSQLAGASFSVSGNRPQTNNFLLDGADNVASSTNQAVPFQVNDSVQEFRVTSGTANAEYGRNMGGTVNIVTKRATNGFHGSTFGFFNNDALNANSPLSVYNGSTFEKAAVYAGPVNPSVNCSTFSSGVPCFLPQTYNDYVSNAAALGFCTNSISTVQTAGLTACPSSASFVNGSLVPLFGRNDFFDPASILAAHDSKNLPFDSKQFGGSGGGALIKDKLFAFGSYEGTLIDNPNPIFERVPSAFDRTFNPYNSELLPLLFSNKMSDPICSSNVIGCKSYALDQSILSLYPQSNVVGVPGVLEFFQGQAPNYTNVHNGLFRTDYVYSEKTDLSLRYVIQDLNQLHDDTLPEQSQYIGNGILRHALNQNLSATMSHTFSSSWVTDARVGFNRFGLTENPQDANFNPSTLGLPDAQLPAILLSGLDPQYGGASPGINGSFAGWGDAFVNRRTAGLLPTLDGRFPLARLGAPLGAPLDRRDTTWFMADNTSWTYGKHGIKFGWEYRRLDNRLEDFSFSRGFMYSSDLGEFTNDSESCNEQCLDRTGTSFNAFRSPSFDFAQQQSDPYKSRLHSYTLAGYIQDSWHIHPRVTLNYGLRYEYFSPPQDKDDNLYNFDPISNGLVRENSTGVVDPYGNPCSATVTSYQSVPAVVSNPNISIPPGNGAWKCSGNVNDFSKIVTSDTNNFAPRLGVAWDIFGTGKTVFRAAAGYFYDQLPASYVSQLMYNRPTTSPNSLYGSFALGFPTFCPVPTFTCANGSALVQPGLLNGPSGVTDKNGNSLPNSFFASAEQPFAVYARDTAHSNTPYSRQLTATIQQQLGSKMTLEVGYLGDHGTNLPVLYNQNFANEANVIENGVAGNFSLFPIYTLTNQGSSDYNSLLVRVRAADWHGLRVNGTYIWSHSIDNASDGVFPPEPLTMPNLAIGYGILGQLNPIGQCLFEGGTPGQFPCAITVTTASGSSTQQIPLTLPTINFNPGAVTTTGAGQIITSRYLIPQDPFNFLANDRGNSDFDIRHRAVVDYTWDVPALSKAWGFPKWLDNWQLSGVVTAQSGQPFSIFSGPIGGDITQRVNVTGPVDVTGNPAGAISVSGLQLASASSSCTAVASVIAPPGGSGFIGNFLQPAPGVACTGDSGRNEFTGPGYVNTNVAIQKGFAVFGEGRMLTFRTEVYNVFNHSNFYNPISSYSLDGQTLNPEFGKILSAHDPRQIQFAVRFSW